MLLRQEWAEDAYCTNEIIRHRVKEVIVQEQTPFQKIEIYDLFDYGLCLFIDGIPQSAVKDEWIYHECLVHPAMVCSHRTDHFRILVLGAGEGASLRELLKYEFIKNIDSHNIVAYSLKGINSGQTIIIFDELRKIFGIGPKLASLFLRDVCFVYKVEPVVREQLICLQPVDTWVMQVSIELGIPGCVKEINRNAVVEPIVDYCLKNKISPSCKSFFSIGFTFVQISEEPPGILMQ